MHLQIHDPRELVNFSAGPALLPYDVLQEIHNNFFDFQNTGCSILEISHRSAPYMDLNTQTQALFRELLDIPQNYKILFAHGGASTQFANIALNFPGKQAYLLTGHFSKNAFCEAQKVSTMMSGMTQPYLVGDAGGNTYSKFPLKQEVLNNITPDSVYVHVTDNNTICGTKTYDIFETQVPIIADMTSSILSEKIDVSQYAMIYASFQKNVGAAGTAVIIIRDEFLAIANANLPDLLSYTALVNADSLYNTPATFNIYTANLVLKWIKKMGGVSEMEALCKKRSSLIYEVIDASHGFYTNTIHPSLRSTTNVVFTLENKDRETEFLEFAESKKLVSLKGHKNIGGIRASMYIGMSVEHVQRLADCMKEFMEKTKSTRL